MKIRAVTPIAVALPLQTPIKMAGEVVSTADNVLVRMETTDGRIGWGEAASGPLMTGETAESMHAAVRFMSGGLIGLDISDPSMLADELDTRMYGNSAAKSAIEMAAYDLCGQSRGVPIAQLLGGYQRREAAVVWLLADNDTGKDVAAARRMADKGFVAFKIKVGLATVEKDLDRCHKIRAALGPAARISADVNQGFTREEAVAFSVGAADAGLTFIEQPVYGHDLEGMAAAAAATTVPIGADEGIHSIRDLERHHEKRAARGASLKSIKLGGLSRVAVAALRMNELGMHVNLACKMADSSIASSALVHLAAALPQLDWDVSPTCQYLVEDIVAEPVRVKRGHVSPSERSGLGIEIDEVKLARFKRAVG